MESVISAQNILIQIKRAKAALMIHVLRERFLPSMASARNAENLLIQNLKKVKLASKTLALKIRFWNRQANAKLARNTLFLTKSKDLASLRLVMLLYYNSLI
jgi:hypothetical protein